MALEPSSCFSDGLCGGGVCSCSPHKEVVGLGEESGRNQEIEQKLSGLLLPSSPVVRCTLVSQAPQDGGCS